MNVDYTQPLIPSVVTWPRWNNETKARARNTRPIGQFHVSMAEGTIGLTRHDPFGRTRSPNTDINFTGGRVSRDGRLLNGPRDGTGLNNWMDESLTNVGGARGVACNCGRVVCHAKNSCHLRGNRAEVASLRTPVTAARNFPAFVVGRCLVVSFETAARSGVELIDRRDRSRTVGPLESLRFSLSLWREGSHTFLSVILSFDARELLFLFIITAPICNFSEKFGTNAKLRIFRDLNVQIQDCCILYIFHLLYSDASDSDSIVDSSSANRCQSNFQ